MGAAMRLILEKDIKPRDIMTKSAFEDAIALTMVLGGSTNAVLHLIAIAHSVASNSTLTNSNVSPMPTPFLATSSPREIRHGRRPLQTRRHPYRHPILH